MRLGGGSVRPGPVSVHSTLAAAGILSAEARAVLDTRPQLDTYPP